MQRSSERKEKIRSANSVLAITTMSHMMQHIYVGISILFPLIMADLSLNYSIFGIALAISSLIGGLFQIFFGVISRRVARHVLLGFGNVLLSFGTFLIGLAGNFVHFVSAKIVADIGTAPQHPMGTAIITEKFDSGSATGKALGIHYGLGYIGNIIGPFFMTLLAVSIGWRNTFFVFSIPALIISVTVILYLKEDKKIVHSDMVRATSSLKEDIVVLMKTKSVIPIILTQALLAGGAEMGILTTYTPLFLADALKLGTYERGVIYTIGLIGGVIGPVFIGKYADKFGYLKIATLSTFIVSILIYLLSFYDTVNSILVFHLFILSFASFSLPTLFQSHLVKITQGYRRDLVIATFFTVAIGFGSIWTAVTGYIIDIYSSFNPAFILMGTQGLVTLVILVDQLRKLKENICSDVTGK